MLAQRERPRSPSCALPIADPAAGLLDALDARAAGFDPADPAWRVEALRRAEQRHASAVGPCGRRLAADAVRHARGRLPSPAPLPSLRDALARRAAVFGPYDGEERPAPAPAPRGPWQALGDAARRAVEVLADRVRP